MTRRGGSLRAWTLACWRAIALLATCVDDLRTTGYLALTVPERLGGLGGSVLDVCIAQEKVSRALGSAGLAANMHTQYIGGSLVSGLWAPERLDAFPARCRGARVAGQQLPGGSGDGQPGARRLTGDDRDARRAWLAHLTGRKAWSTASTLLTHFAVSATVRAPGVPEHLGQFLVTSSSPGVGVDPTWQALSMRESASHDIVFEDVFVRDADVIRVSDAGETFVPSWEVAPWHGLPFAATYTGIAVAARDWVARFAATRVPTNLGKPIGDLPAVRAKLGEIEALLFASRRPIFDTARDWVEGRMDRASVAAQVPLVKYHATNNAVRVTDLALRIAGGAGLPNRRRWSAASATCALG